MKIKTYIFVIIISTLFGNCSNDDEPETTAIIGKSISFVKQDGTPITPLDCINPNENYYVSINVTPESTGELLTSAVRYTINGAVYSMTFKTLESQLNPITLIEGENVAQLVNTGFITRISYITTPNEFELVE